MSTSSRLQALLITVNYKNAESTLNLTQSLKVLDGFRSLEVVVVDNASGDARLYKLKDAIQPLSNVRLLISDTNRGYFGAAKFALDCHTSQGRELPNWIIICNHDVVFPDESFLKLLSAYDPNGVGMIAPRVTAVESGTEQNPFLSRRPGMWKRCTMRFYASCYPLGVLWDWLSRAKKNLKRAMSSPEGSPLQERKQIYAGHGSCLIFSRAFFDRGGYLDDGLFLFGEEIASGEICRRLQLPVIYEPAMRILHDEHQSTGIGMSRKAYQYHRRAVRRVFTKYLVS